MIAHPMVRIFVFRDELIWTSVDKRLVCLYQFT